MVKPALKSSWLIGSPVRFLTWLLLAASKPTVWSPRMSTTLTATRERRARPTTRSSLQRMERVGTNPSENRTSDLLALKCCRVWTWWRRAAISLWMAAWDPEYW